jgi:hypothetical protein
MQYIGETLREKPDFVYIVNEETAKNVEISLKYEENSMWIPKQFSTCLENFINLTNYKNTKKIKILRITPLLDKSKGGYKFLDNSIPKDQMDIPALGVTVVNNPSYNGESAAQHLIKNKETLRRWTGIEGDLYIITLKTLPQIIQFYISKIEEISMPKRIKQPAAQPVATPAAQPVATPAAKPTENRMAELLFRNKRPVSSDDKNKKYFYKYLKYKQKYLEAQKLYGKDLIGGANEYKYIFCPSAVYNLIKSLFPEGKNIFNDLNCFNLLLGPRSYYKINPKVNIAINCWNEQSNNNFRIPEDYKIFSISRDVELNSISPWKIYYA